MWLGLSYPPDDNRSCVRYLVANNLLSGPSDIHVNECAGELQLRHNPDCGDLHLTPGAEKMLTAGTAYEEISEDIDGRTRGRTPTPGAHEIE